MSSNPFLGRSSRRRFLAGLASSAVLPLLSACQPQVVETERVQVVEKDVPVDRIVTQIVRQEVERVVTVEVEKQVQVERVVTVEVEVEKPVEVQKFVTVEVEKPVEVEKIVTVEVEKPVELVVTQVVVKEKFILEGIPGIVDPANGGWPREVEGLNGLVSIAAKPARIHTVSLGHDEVTYALVPAERVVAVGTYTQLPEYSNVAALAQKVVGIGRDPEQIVAQAPDIVIASPYTKKDLIQALENAGIVVVQTQLHNDPAGRIQDILLMGYLFGEEERALALAAEVRSRHRDLLDFVRGKPIEVRPRVLALTSFSDKLYVAGIGSTEGNIIETAGGINVAAEAGIERNTTTSLEGVVAMSPEVIIITQPADGANEFRQELLRTEALAEVPAIKDARVYPVDPKLFTTLSFWNIRGAEELAKILWPDDFGNREFPQFSLPE